MTETAEFMVQRVVLALEGAAPAPTLVDASLSLARRLGVELLALMINDPRFAAAEAAAIAMHVDALGSRTGHAGGSGAASRAAGEIARARLRTAARRAGVACSLRLVSESLVDAVRHETRPLDLLLLPRASGRLRRAAATSARQTLLFDERIDITTPTLVLGHSPMTAGRALDAARRFAADALMDVIVTDGQPSDSVESLLAEHAGRVRRDVVAPEALAGLLAKRPGRLLIVAAELAEAIDPLALADRLDRTVLLLGP